METVTIACPKGLSDESVDISTAPIWVDSNKNEYFIASGVMEGYSTTEPVKAIKTRVNIVVGVDGLTALGMMELTPKSEVL